jgi:sec-independent protein translocase protein TatC
MTPEPSHAADHDRPMTLVEHLRELRARLIKTSLAVALGMSVGFLLAGRVQRYFLDLIARIAPEAEVIATTATEKITVFFTIALYIGVALAMPVILYQAIRFLAPGLTRTERRHVYGLLPGTLLCFAGGVAFALAVAIPQMLGFLLNFGDPGIRTTPRAAELLGFCSELALWTGLAFELPMIMFLCATLNIIPHAVLRRGRKYAAVGLMVLAALITPTPDALSMLVIWAPLYLLFELGLILTRFARPRGGSSTLALLGSLLLARQLRRGRIVVAPALLG